MNQIKYSKITPLQSLLKYAKTYQFNYLSLAAISVLLISGLHALVFHQIVNQLKFDKNISTNPQLISFELDTFNRLDTQANLVEKTAALKKAKPVNKIIKPSQKTDINKANNIKKQTQTQTQTQTNKQTSKQAKTIKQTAKTMDEIRPKISNISNISNQQSKHNTQLSKINATQENEKYLNRLDSHLTLPDSIANNNANNHTLDSYINKTKQNLDNEPEKNQTLAQENSSEQNQKKQTSTESINKIETAETAQTAEIINTTIAEQAIENDLPSTQQLYYRAYINGSPNRDGYIKWQKQGDNYSVKFSTSIIFLGQFSFESQGKINNQTLEPTFYKEVRGSKNYTANFDHIQKQVSFTRNGQSSQLKGFTLDYMSLPFYLTALFKQKPPVAGKIYQFLVADTKGVQLWKIQAKSKTETYLWPDGASVQAWHFVRLARDGNDKRVLEWWLVPEYDWLPGKIAQTEPNGIQFEFGLDKQR